MEEKTYQTPCGTIHYWTNVSHPDEITLVFLPGLTADHRLFDKHEYYGAAEPPVRCGESHLSGLTEPLRSL